VARDEYVWSDETHDGSFRVDGLSPGAYRVALFRGSSLRFAGDNGQLGTEITIVDADVELRLVGAVDDG
jgi:hypothetical protein